MNPRSTSIRHSTTHPNYLHSNSTSHKFPFSAIAELVDNSVDSQATNLFIDIAKDEKGPFRIINEETNPRPSSLIFTDDGCGMDLVHLHKMMSFGHCDKVDGTRPAIGRYGNGFKSGSMRLGRDAIVFTKHDPKFDSRSSKLRDGSTPPCTMSVGLLSQTFLHKIKSEEVLVPMASFTLPDMEYAVSPPDRMEDDLKLIYKHSPFHSMDALIHQFDAIPGSHGTRIIIFNLRRKRKNSSSNHDRISDLEFEAFEDEQFKQEPDENANNIDIESDEGQVIPVGASVDFDFSRSPKDICLLDNAMGSMMPMTRGSTSENANPVASTFSLSAYLSILYLDPFMQVYIRGIKIHPRRLEATLYKPRQYVYKPKDSDAMTLTFGFQIENFRNDYGMMLYHKGRLIRWLYRVGMQLSPDSRGVGVVGIVNSPRDFLTPTHNKADFIEDKNFRFLMSKLIATLRDYWAASTAGSELANFWRKLAKTSLTHWVRCVLCSKWRRVENLVVPDDWECDMNMDENFNHCNTPQERPIFIVDSDPVKKQKDAEKSLRDSLSKAAAKVDDSAAKLEDLITSKLRQSTTVSEAKCRLAAIRSGFNLEKAHEWLILNEAILEGLNDEDVAQGVLPDGIEDIPVIAEDENIALASTRYPSRRRVATASYEPQADNAHSSGKKRSSSSSSSTTTTTTSTTATGEGEGHQKKKHKSKKKDRRSVSPPVLSRQSEGNPRSSRQSNSNSNTTTTTNTTTNHSHANNGNGEDEWGITSTLRYEHTGHYHPECSPCKINCDKIRFILAKLLGKSMSCSEAFDMEDTDIQDAIDERDRRMLEDHRSARDIPSNGSSSSSSSSSSGRSKHIARRSNPSVPSPAPNGREFSHQHQQWPMRDVKQEPEDDFLNIVG